MINQNDLLEKTKNVKHQLYLYFIMHLHVYGYNYQDFFINGFNFGWLSKSKGFTSFFTEGIENDRWFENVNPIFQTYNSNFRYNGGLKNENALKMEIVGNGRKRNTFQLLEEWAKS